MTIAEATKTWSDILDEEKAKPYFQKILNYVAAERAKGKEIYPPQDEIFNALTLTPFDNVKVVLLGQDPYHGENQAHGLSFSVKPGIKAPPSLANIYDELKDDLGINKPNHGYLAAWTKQGVLMLNSVLTVENGKPQSHANIGWQEFTDRIITSLNSHPEGIVFLLWGSYAQRKSVLINTNRHLVLMAPHPSPLSAHRGFFGCKHFSKANKWLVKMGREPIDWQLGDL